MISKQRFCPIIEVKLILNLIQTSLQLFLPKLLLLMFSCPHIIRQSVKGISIPRLVENRYERNSRPQDLYAPCKQIETRNSMLSPSLKTSIINDCDYNSSIYEWRKQEVAPIVNVIQIAKRSQIDSVTGASRIFNTIKPEPYQSTLSNFRSLSKQQLLYVFKNLLEGYQAIFKKMKAASVSLQKCIINLEGCVKVWVNQQFERNDISGEILSKQDLITKRIFEMVCFLASNNTQQKIQGLTQYVESSMNKSGKWTFNGLKGMLKSYCDCLRIKVPNHIQIKNRVTLKRPFQSTVISKQKQLKMERPRQRSFQLGNRNATSSLNSTTGFIYEKKKFGSGNVLDQLVKNPTSKSINENETNCTIQTLPTKTKHTNSISQFQSQEDPILEVSRHRESRNSSVTIESANESRRMSSINEILLNKIGFCSLPEVHCEEEFSNCPSARKQERIEQEDNDRRVSLTIASQFSLKIEKIGSENAKQSSISTTNQTSDSCNQFCFFKKVKDSHLTINFEQNKQNRNESEDFKTASRDRFKDSILVTQTQPKKHIVGSCTNWSSKRDSIELSQMPKQVKISKFCTQVERKQAALNSLNISTSAQSKLLETEIQASLKQLGIEDSIKEITPEKNFKQVPKALTKIPISLLTQLRSVQELQSYENTEKNSVSAQSQNPSVKKLKMPIEEKIMELLNLNRNLVVSTYMQTSSEKKIKQTDSPDKLRQRKLKDIEETLSQLIHANLKQKQIIEGNKWTKRLENLLGIEEQMKQSISFGTEEACALLRQIKLSKIGKWGRAIGTSRVETEECQ